MEGIELLNQEIFWTLGEKKIYKYLGILEADAIKQAEMKEKIRKWHLRRTRIQLENKLYSWHLIKGKNTRSFPPPWKILGISLKMDKGWTQTNGQTDKKIDDDG